MPQQTVTFTLYFLNTDTGIQDSNVIPWTTGLENSLVMADAFKNIDSSNAGFLTGQITTGASLTAPATWKPTFIKLDAGFAIFAKTAPNTYVTVTVGGGTTIGNYVDAGAKTCNLYLFKKSLPDDVSASIFGLQNATAVGAIKSGGDIATYINAQATIRVLIPTSPGTGHQTTTCNIIRRLISKGFANTFEVIYAPTEANVKVIKLLLPELGITYTNSGTTYTISNGTGPGNTYSSPALGNCPFLFTAQGTALATQVEFGFSGGVDTTSVDPRAADITNTQFFLMLQPFQWNAANYFFGVMKIDLGDLPLLGKLNFLGKTCYYVDYATYSDWAGVSAYAAQIPAPYTTPVTDIQAQCYAAQNFNVLPVYGLTMDGTGPVLSNWKSVNQISALANLVLSVLQGQGSGPMQKGTVIMTLDAYQTTLTTGTSPIYKWVDDLKKLLPAAYANRVTMWPQTATDAWNTTKITGLQQNEILIVNLPKILPMPVFNYFYLKSSMPPIFEGKGTMPLMLNAGVPYLQLSKQNDGLDTIKSLNPTATIKQMKVFLFPTLATSPIVSAAGTETTPQGDPAKKCLAAGNGVVWNNADVATVIKPETFTLSAGTDYNAIVAYLQTNNYIDASNEVLNKFWALPDATYMEAQATTLVKTNAEIFAAIKGAPASYYTGYNTKIAALTAFFGSAMTADSALQQYFTALGDYFHDETNDKLLKGFGYAVAAIPGT